MSITFENVTPAPLEFSRGGFLVPPGERKTVEASLFWVAWTAFLVKQGQIKLIPAESGDAAPPSSAPKSSPAPTGAKKKPAARRKTSTKKVP